jgi:hypothetical protein
MPKTCRSQAGSASARQALFNNRARHPSGGGNASVGYPPNPEFTPDRALAATREPHTHRLTNEGGTKEAQNEKARNAFQNEGTGDDAAAIA